MTSVFVLVVVVGFPTTGVDGKGSGEVLVISTTIDGTEMVLCESAARFLLRRMTAAPTSSSTTTTPAEAPASTTTKDEPSSSEV